MFTRRCIAGCSFLWIELATSDNLTFMPKIVASDALILWSADQLQSLVNSGHFLRLFANDLDPDPSTPLGDFVEATYGGYSPIDLSGLFPSPIQIQPGEYQLPLPDQPFGCTGTPIQSVFGWWIDDGATWKMAARFPTPVVLTVGKNFTLSIYPQGWALSLLP